MCIQKWQQYLERFNLFLKTLVILFSNQSNYQIMNQKSSSAEDQTEGGGRFLMRHSSSSVLDLFGCCSPSSSNILLSDQPERASTQKISIKSVMKKSGIYGYNAAGSVSESRFYQGEKRSQLGSNSQKFLNRKISQFSQVSGQTINNRTERVFPKKKYENINLIYNKESQDNSIHNYHTTNYLVEKYFVQADKTSIFLKDQKEKKLKSAQDLPTNSNDLARRRKTQEADGSPKWGHEVSQFPPPKIPVNKTDNAPINCHFSFGQHQKNMFMSKFGGIREVCSNRPSKQSGYIQNQEDAASIDLADNQSKPFNFAKCKRQKLNNLVRNVQVLNEDVGDMSSDKSQVIDSYQNFMSRIQDRSKFLQQTKRQ